MRSFLNVALIAVAIPGAAAGCGTRGGPLDAIEPPPEAQVGSAAPAVDAVPVVEQCQPVTSIEVVHRVAGNPQTDRVRLVDTAGSDPGQAMLTFQAVADH